MKTLILMCAALLAAAPVAAAPSRTAPVKKQHVPAAPRVAGPRIGGDTIETAVGIFTLPYADTGSTLEALDDYDEICPWDGSTSPDVVYAIKQSTDTYVTIDLCGSGYDTRVFVYDYLRILVGCNDDRASSEPPCNPLDSRIDALLLEAGVPYYIIIDGYGGDSGDYALSVNVADVPVLDCPDGAQVEGEPPMVYGITDEYNCGCFCANPPPRFQKLAIDPAGTTFACFRSGWNGIPGGSARDFDWIATTVGAGGHLHCELAVEWPSELTVMPPTCEFAGHYGSVGAAPGEVAVLDIQLAPGTPVWIFLTPSPFVDPGLVLPMEYDLHLTIDGQATTTANEA
ncbi:MAG: hypothetical protein Q7W29_09235, partial [bacterium]|nr:hypothetical protein [bacterium]